MNNNPSVKAGSGRSANNWWNWRSSRAFPGNGEEDAEESGLEPWLKTCRCIPPKANGDFVRAMEDVPDVHGGDHDAGTGPACVDGTSRQQTKETRKPPPVRPGQPAGCDFGQERGGTASLFMIHAPLDGRRHVKVTDLRTRQDFARVPRDLAVAPLKEVVHVYRAASRQAIRPEQEIQSLANRRLSDAVAANDDCMAGENDLALGDAAKIGELESTYPHPSASPRPMPSRAAVAAGIR